MITLPYPQTLYVGSSHLEPYTEESWEDIRDDPRGLLLMWEPPRPDCKYVMAMDATEGITGWTRATKVDGDHKTDNTAIVIFRPDGLAEPIYKVEDGKKVPDVDPVTKRQRILFRDVQVAEWAAPVDAVEAARVANFLGRVFHGSADDQCLFIWEAWPGVGLLATQEILRLGYSNMWMWEYIDKEAEETDRPGWRSTPTSQRLLWYRARRHLMNHQAVIKSPFLLEEYRNAEIDLTKMRARAAYGYHDDRFMAANMCFWASHAWTYEEDSTPEPVTTAPWVDYQRYAPGLDDYESFTDWKQRATDDWWE